MDFHEIVRKCYLDVLKREPDELGLNHYLNLMKNNEIDENKLVEILRNSDEYTRKKSAEIHDEKMSYVFRGSYDIDYLIRPNSVLDDIVVRNGIYDKWICSKLDELIHKDSVIFDIGANVGLLTIPFAKKYVPFGFVYAFEPAYDLVSHLKKNIEINKLNNIIVEQLGLQDDPLLNKITLHRRQAIHDDGLRNDGLSTMEKNFTFKIAEEIVNSSTVDKYVIEHNIAKLGLIKIDVEGAEYKILNGSKKTIDALRPIVIYEYSPTVDKLIDFENSKKSFEFLKKMDYQQYLIINEENLIEMSDYTADFADSNIICFYKSNLPSWI